MIRERLRHDHIAQLAEQGCEVGELLTRPSYLTELLAVGPGFAGVVPEGIVAIMGMCEQNKGNFRCWAHTDARLAPKHFLALNHAIKAFFAECKAERIETVVLAGNFKGEHWVRMQGFQYEGTMRKYHMGQDAWLFARVQ